MRQIEHFVPGIPDEDEGVLSRWRWPIPTGVTRAYTEAYTHPGDTVLVPYCQGPAAVREVVAVGRRALALNFDPVMVLIAEAALRAPPARDLDVAVVRLGDSLKQEVPLRRYLQDLYATTCPACLRPAVADYFIWDREPAAPVAKYLRCPACAWDGQAAVDPEDRARLAEVPAQGMHYHYVLDRVAAQPLAGAHRARLEALLELYSPRNLYALAELTLRTESLVPEGPLRRALFVVLLDCLDRCSSLAPLPTRKQRRRSLSPPSRFLERNVWHAFEASIARFQASVGAPLSNLAQTLDAFQESGALQPASQEATASIAAAASIEGTAAEEAGVESVGFVGQELVRNLSQVLSPRSMRLILTSPPALNSAAWVLSYFWGAWLLGAEAVAPSRPLLRQRTPDPMWYAKVMAGALRNLAALLRDDGRLVLVLSGQRQVVVEALLLAAARARLGVASLVQRGADYRLELASGLPQGTTPMPGPLNQQIRMAAAQEAADTIRARGEPVAWRTLHAAILQRLATLGLMVRALGAEGEGPSSLDLIAEQVHLGLDDPAFVRLPGTNGGDELWWLADPSGAAPALCDRVEEIAHEVLLRAEAVSGADFAQAVYAQFPGALTPEADLVAACLRELGREGDPDLWQLRPEELPDARRTERQEIVEDLLALGERLGYRAAAWSPFEAAWFEGERIRAAFVVRWRAAVSDALALGDQLRGARPYLVIPGGRAALVSYKLARNPLWQHTVEETGWHFIKYRHVRQLVGEPDVDAYALQTIIGLDPIVEKEQAQLPLF
jgi:hypothetical protein